MSRQRVQELVPAEQGFDYASLAPAVAREVRNTTRQIRARVKRTIRDIIEVGIGLLAVQDALPYGQFGPYLRSEFGWTDRTARNFKAVAAWLSDRMEIVSELHLAPSAAYLLAGRSAPDSARQLALRRAQTGERITPRVAREILEQERAKLESGRKGRRLPASHLAPRLAKVLARYQERCEPSSAPERARQLREFADTLEANRPGPEKGQKR